MADPFVPRIGGVLSADIAAPDHVRLRDFYSRVLGTGDEPHWDDELMNNLGMPIIGIGERVEAYEHLPLQWMPHIQVADVATGVERALAIGGDELLHGKADDGRSQWAVLRDPNGAAFGIIPVSDGTPPPSDDADRAARATAGRIAWLNLTVPDARTTLEFYREVIGWSFEDVAMRHEDGDYTDYHLRGDGPEPVAGISHARGIGEGLPAVWMIHLPVGDLAESVRRVEAGGGQVVKVSHGDEGAPSRVAVRDPVGAYVALLGHLP